MEWKDVLYAWGPMAVGLWFLWKLHRDVVYKAIPRGFELIRKEMRLSREATESRFRRHHDRLASIEEAVRLKAGRKRRARLARRRPRRGTPKKKAAG